MRVGDVVAVRADSVPFCRDPSVVGVVVKVDCGLGGKVTEIAPVIGHFTHWFTNMIEVIGHIDETDSTC